MKKLNILQIYDYMELGGAESHIITLSQALLSSGNNVIIASSMGPSVERIDELGIKYYHIDFYKPFDYFSNAEKVIEIIEAEKIDIVHVHPSYSQIAMCLVKIFTKIPIVTTIHGHIKVLALKVWLIFLMDSYS